MSDDREEIELDGGNMSSVVRVGDTVRRQAGHWTPAVHALLCHLEQKGFALAPRVLGSDERGREVLSFLPGETVGSSKPWPVWTQSEATLVQAGRLLRRLHEAVADFVPPAGARWRLSDAALAPGEIVCHNDVAPYNIAWHAGQITGLFDWDVAGPGRPADDLAFAAWNFVPLFDDAHCRSLGWQESPERARRLCSIVESYGLEMRVGFVDVIAARMQASLTRIQRGAEAGDPAFIGLVAGGHLGPVEDALALVERIGNELQRAIETDPPNHTGG